MRGPRVAAPSDLLDLNVWLALSASEHPFHPRARQYWREEAGDRLVFCRVTMLGFLRLTTNATAMGGQPLTAREAWAAYVTWRRLDYVSLAPEPDGCEALLADWGEREIVPPRLWTDAYIAAFAMKGAYRVVTFDQDFKRFDGLEVLLLDT